MIGWVTSMWLDLDCAVWNVVKSDEIETTQSFINRRETMNGLIYLIGLVVVVLAILSFFGLH
jgi:hypothetical protein